MVPSAFLIWTPRCKCLFGTLCAGSAQPEGDVPGSVSFNIGAQLHFNKDGFLGWQQMLSLKVTL